MKPLALLGIYRERVYSPGKVEDDAAIMDATLEELARRGWEVGALAAEALTGASPRPQQVLTMAQSEQALHILKDWSRQGTRVINSVPSVRNCYRKSLTHLLTRAGVCVPPSRIMKLEEAEQTLSVASAGRLWLKRGDVHAMEPGDVASVACRKELDRALAHFGGRNIREIVAQEHVPGPVVKFYGVGEGGFFRAYPAAGGDEVTVGLGPLAALARQAATAVGLEVYGGDAVLSETDGPVLIDLNDWPSFARCRFSAARSIAACVDGELRQRSS